MLITFKSPGGSDVVMFEKNARQLVGVLGKDADAPQGVVTVDQLPGAMDALDIAMAADHEIPPVSVNDEEDTEQAEAGVGFWQRAIPLRELLKRAMKGKVPVTWGV